MKNKDEQLQTIYNLIYQEDCISLVDVIKKTKYSKTCVVAVCGLLREKNLIEQRKSPGTSLSLRRTSWAIEQKITDVTSVKSVWEVGCTKLTVPGWVLDDGQLKAHPKLSSVPADVFQQGSTAVKRFLGVAA